MNGNERYKVDPAFFGLVSVLGNCMRENAWSASDIHQATLVAAQQLAEAAPNRKAIVAEIKRLIDVLCQPEIVFPEWPGGWSWRNK